MNIGQLIVSLGVDTTELTAAKVAMVDFEKSTTKSINATAQRLRTFGYLASTALTAPIVLAGKASLKMASDYEYSMQKIVGLTGVAQSQVTEWSDSILKLGPALARKPQELADALYYISSSGIKGAQAMDVLKLSAKAATAGMGTTQTMANVLTSALNAYRGTGLTAAYATDVLVAAVREGKAEAEGFSTSIGQIIPIASQLGVSFDQVAGGMAAITLTGASSANAAVYLKGVFNSLLTASTQGEKALNSIGSSYAQLRNILATQGLVPLMQKLRDIQVTYGDELLSDVVPNIRALLGVLSFAGKNFQYNTELMKRVTESTGSLGKAWAAVADTIKVRYDSALSSINVSMISLGKSIATTLLPMLEHLAGYLSKMTEHFNSLSEAQKRHRIIMLSFIAAIGPATLVISLLMYSISGIIAVFTKFGTTLLYVTNIIRALTGSTTALRAAMASNAVLTKGLIKVLSNPWVLAAAAIGTVIALVVHYTNKIKRLKEEQESFNTSMVKVAGTMTNLKNLTSSDYSIMSLEELKAARAAVQKEWNAAYSLMQQGEKNAANYEGKLFAPRKANIAFMQEQKNHISQLKVMYDDLGIAIDKTTKEQAFKTQIEQQQKILEITRQEREEIEKRHAALEKYLEELKEQNKEIERQNRIERQNSMTQYSHDYGTFFKKSTLGSQMPATGNQSDYQRAMNEELQKQAFLNSLVGDSYDVLSAQVDVYRKAIEELYSTDLYKKGNAAAISTMDALIIKYKELSEQAKVAKAVQDLTKDSLSSLSRSFEEVGSAIGGAGGDMLSWIADVLRRLPEIISMFATLTTIRKLDAAAAKKEAMANAIQAASMRALLGPMGAVAAGELAKAKASGTAAGAGAASAVASIPIAGPVLAIAAIASVMAALLSMPKLAKGGIIPPGYPNDTYPALLTSGERVVPPGKLTEEQGATGGFFEIAIVGNSRVKGDDIVYVYDKRVKTLSKY